LIIEPYQITGRRLHVGGDAAWAFPPRAYL
jgi:hypothetical protein